jgi:hypothetical protein
MKPRVLPTDMAIFDLGEELFHTSALLRAFPFLATHAAQFEPFHPDWLALLQQEIDLARAVREAEARVISVDNDFDFLCMAISGTLLAENGNDRKTPVYLRYFGDAPPSKLKRPVLGPQVVVMRGWVSSLTSAEASPALQEYGRQLAARVVDADAATRALTEAEHRRADFEILERKAFIDRLNGHRQVLYGQLAELPHRHPEWHLGNDFAHRFFLRDPGTRRTSIPELEETLRRLRARVRKHEARLAALLEHEEREARLRDEAELAAARDELTEIERQRAEAAERLAAAQARRTSRRA